MAVNFTIVAKIIKLCQIVLVLYIIFTAVKITSVKVGASPLWGVCSDQPFAQGKGVYREENPKEAIGKVPV